MNKVKAPVRRTVPGTKPAESETRFTETVSRPESNETFALGPMNYKLAGIGILVLIVGYFLLSTEKFVDATKFSIALYVAPFVILGGYVQIIYAIMYRKKTVS